MKYPLIIAISLLCFGSLYSSELPSLKNLIVFTENKGQIHDQNYNQRPDVLFGSQVGELLFHLRNSGISYQIKQAKSHKGIFDFKTNQTINEIDKIIVHRIDLNWINSNTTITKETDDALSSFNNYYLENCPNGALNVKSYKGVTLKNIYNNINVHYYEKDGQLKHDYIVAPNANYRQIKLKVEGAKVLSKKDGGLILKTSLGEIEESKPIVYQLGKTLNSKWVVKGDTISFFIEGYDPNLELVIDPITRIWGTYYGGSGLEYSRAIATDATGNIYQAGSSTSTSLIATTGSHQQTLTGGPDAMLLKFNNFGSLIWGTYYGGQGIDYSNSCNLDQSGNIYFGGYTYSSTTTLIATSGCHQGNYGGGQVDAFLVKFNSSGVRQWGTYYGGSGEDQITSICTDATGNVFFTGRTTTGSGTSISTSGSHQPNFGGTSEGFLVKFNSSGVRQWGTYYGGGGDDIGRACATDGAGNVYLTGTTDCQTGTIIATSSSYQSIHAGSYDSYLAKFNSSGVRQWGTYYGGSGLEHGFALSTDASNNIYLSGSTSTSSGTNIATPGSFQLTNGGGGSDAFLVKFDNSGARLWGTFYGGSGTEENYSSAVDGTGNLYITGSTSTTGSVNATTNGFQIYHGGGGGDNYLAKYNNTGTLLWATYYGGSGLEQYGASCATDINGAVFLGSQTTSSVGTEIATLGSYQPTYGGSQYDAFLVKFKDCPAISPSITVNNSICSGNNLILSSSNSATFVPSYYWVGPNNYTSSVQSPTVNNVNSNNQGTYILTVHDGTGCSAVAITSITVYASPTVAVNSGTICSGSSFTISPSGAVSYSLQGNNYIISPTITSSYTITGMSSDGCASINTATSNVYIDNPTISVNSGSICNGSSFTISPSGASNYIYSGGTNIISPTITSTYSIFGSSLGGCLSTSPAICNVFVYQLPTITVNSGSICLGSNFTISPSGASTYSYSMGGAGIVSPSVSTNYYVTGTNSVGCVAHTIAVSSITVVPVPSLTIISTKSVICAGESSTLIVSGASSYTWSNNSVLNNVVVSPSVNTNYSVVGKNDSGCSTSKTFVQNVAKCLGTSENYPSIDSPEIYPNPCSGAVRFVNVKNKRLIIINSLGKILLNSFCDENVLEFNVENYSVGIYLVIITNINDGSRHSLKLIKQ